MILCSCNLYLNESVGGLKMNIAHLFYGRRKKIPLYAKLLVIFSGVFLLCEFAIYYIIIYQCSWPVEKDDNFSNKISQSKTLKVMFLADTHLLGNIKGHWFDKLRREWQMHRAFQTAVKLFQPEAIFFLGDIFDEGQWVSEEYFKEYVARFHSLFYVPEGTKSYVVVGNHDIGFHYVITPYLHSRFNKAFNSSSVRLIRLKESNFVLINSMAMERDGCFLCHSAVKELQRISNKLYCERDPESCALSQKDITKLRSYSSPILLQHFPLYRESDQICSGQDSAPDDEKKIAFRENWECLSNESSRLLLTLLKPRLIMSGHTHHYCLVRHVINGNGDSEDIAAEYSVPSFSWRNRNDPSFFLGLFLKDDYKLSKCYMPQETTVISFYYSSLFLAIFTIFQHVYGYIRNVISALRLR